MYYTHLPSYDIALNNIEHIVNIFRLDDRTRTESLFLPSPSSHDPSFNRKSTQISLVIPNPALPAQPTIPNRSVNVRNYGAIANDGKSDTAAIQRAIDAVVGLGGGSVLFDAGVYDLSIQNPQASLPQALFLKSNLRLASSTTSGATLRLMNNQGNYESIMGTTSYGTLLSNFVLERLTLDSNTQNNLLSSTRSSTNPGLLYNFQPGNYQLFRYVLRVFNGNKILVNNCSLINQGNVNVLTFNGESAPNVFSVQDISVTNSTFTNVGGGAVDYDHSSIYTNGLRIKVDNNSFASTNGAGTKGARTALEIHGVDQTITNNRVNGFTVGVNVVGGGYTGGIRQKYLSNTLSNVNQGFLLWPLRGNQPLGQAALQNIEISSNTVNINADDWLAAQLESATLDGPSAGISLEPNSDAPINSLNMTNNTISFVKATTTTSFFHDFFSSGVTFWKYTNQDKQLENINVAGNKIYNALGVGTWSNATLKSVTFDNNDIYTPLRSDRFLQLSQSDAYVRAGLYFEGSSQLTSVTNNRVHDSRSPQRVLRAVGYPTTLVCVNCVESNNSLLSQ